MTSRSQFQALVCVSGWFGARWEVMIPHTLWSRVIAVALLAVCAPPSIAGVLKIKEVRLAARQDRGALSGMAVTHVGDVLSFVAENTGNWQLYRIRSWSGGQPTIQTITLSGYFSRAEQPDMEMLNASVLATSDARYAICVGSAEWVKRVRGRAVGNVRSDDLIAVVDLASFKVISTARTRDLGLPEFHEVHLDPAGQILVDSLSQGKPKKGAFTRLSLPAQAPGSLCNYNWITASPTQEHREADATEGCRSELGSKSISDYFESIIPKGPWPPAGCDNDNQAQYCRLPTVAVTENGKFGIALYTTVHDNILGNWVETQQTYVAFSTERRADIGRIDVSPRDSNRLATFARNGRDYLLLVANGTRLVVYELID